MPTLPTSLQDKILTEFAQSVLVQGGAWINYRQERLRPLKLVNKHWYEWAKLESSRWVSYDFCTREKEFLNFPRKVTFSAKEVESRLEKRKEAPGGENLRGIRIEIDNPYAKSFKDRSKKWKGALDRVIEQMKGAVELELDLQDEPSGNCCELIWRFSHLEKLYIKSSLLFGQSVLIFPPKPSFASLGSSLSRIDLGYLVIGDWKLSLPNVKLLTIDHVTFGGDGSVCRDFFGSFPNLAALGMCRPMNLVSDAFIRLGFSTLVHLYLGDCCFGESTPLGRIGSNSNFSCTDFLRSLARHFRSRIKHLYLPGHCQASALIDILLSSRIGNTFPAYLVKLESICIAPPPRDDGAPEEDKLLSKKYEALTMANNWNSRINVDFWPNNQEYTFFEWVPGMGSRFLNAGETLNVD